MFKTGYILSRRADIVWFLGLPFFAVAVALGFQAWLPYVAIASINLWITIPHHYAGCVRSYGTPEVWERSKDRLIVGPIAIIGFTIAGLQFAPITMLLLVTAWDHQHSLMQHHGLARIYDFKAGAGMPSTRRFDLGLHCVLYGYMFLSAPMFPLSMDPRAPQDARARFGGVRAKHARSRSRNLSEVKRHDRLLRSSGTVDLRY